MTLQPEDDHERVREAVARTLAVGLMSNDFSVELNDWLNSTEVRCGIICLFIDVCVYDERYFFSLLAILSCVRLFL